MQLGKLPNASQYERPPLRTYFRVVVAEINRQSNAVARACAKTSSQIQTLVDTIKYRRTVFPD